MAVSNNIAARTSRKAGPSHPVNAENRCFNIDIGDRHLTVDPAAPYRVGDIVLARLMRSHGRPAGGEIFGQLVRMPALDIGCLPYHRRRSDLARPVLGLQTADGGTLDIALDDLIAISKVVKLTPPAAPAG